MRVRLIALLAFVYIGMSAPAEASTWWGSVGAACTPASSAIQNNLYSISGGSVSVSSGAPVVLYCPVHFLRFAGSPNRLVMTSKGQNGSAPTGTSSITAQLVSMNLTSGAETVLATLSGASSLTPVLDATSFSHVFNFETNYYYVKVTLSGDGSSTYRTKTIYGVRLETYSGP